MYKVSLFMDESHDISLRLHLTCNIFTSIQTELTSYFKKSTHRKSQVTKLEVAVAYTTKNWQTPLTELLDGIHYLIVTTILNLEQQFPLVFSLYGRKFFTTNYNWLVRGVKEILQLPFTSNLPCVDLHIASKIVHLHNMIVENYTTVQLIQKKKLDQNVRPRELRDPEKTKPEHIAFLFDFLDASIIAKLLL